MSSEVVIEPADPGEELSDKQNELLARLDRVDEQLAELSKLFHARIEDDGIKSQLFEQLYLDLSRYRDDFVFTSITRRIFTDVLRLFDRVDATLDDRTLPALSRDDLVAHLTSFRNEILQCLRRQEVLVIDSPPGYFDEAWQEAVETRPVDRCEDDQKVMEVVRKGFTYRGRILRPASVIVGRYIQVKEGHSNG